MTDIAWTGDPMTYAKTHIARGVLRVDDQGRIWRERLWAGGRWRDIAPRRAESPAAKGYLRVALGIPGGTIGVKAHRLVYEAIVGPIPDGLEINHKNLDKHDNRPDNLEPMTGGENIQHSYDHGRRRPWSAATEWRRGRPKMTPEQIATARTMRARGDRLKTIATALGISTTHAHRITEGAATCKKG